MYGLDAKHTIGRRIAKRGISSFIDHVSNLREQLTSFLAFYRRSVLDNSGLKRAGVLIPIFEKNDEPYFLLTRRTQDVEHHKGQISFPGGSVDGGDRDIVGTALRETQEEIGLAPEFVDVLGLFNDLTIPTGFVVTPVVGFLTSVPALKLNVTEVDSVFEAPFSFFREPGNRKVVAMTRGGQTRDVYFFTFGEYEIWGATAFMIDSFLKELVGHSQQFPSDRALS